MFKKNPKALQNQLFCDDVELCNPLALKTKTHKIGKCIVAWQTFEVELTVFSTITNLALFYYTIGNPELSLDLHYTAST